VGEHVVGIWVASSHRVHVLGPVRLSARLAEGVVYDLDVITLECSGFGLCVYKPPITVYRKEWVVGRFLHPQAHFPSHVSPQGARGGPTNCNP